MRILVIEDEKRVADFIKRGLEEEYYQIEVAEDGEDGVYLGQSGHYDLILLDLRLPKIDGIRVCRQLRNSKVSTPILMLTAKDAVEDKVIGLDSGADDYLTKPFDFAELLARIRTLMRRGRSEVLPKLQTGDLALDTLTHRVSRGGKEIQLSSKEYALLEYLMRHSGQVVTRTMIAQQVWGYDFDSYTNVIDVYVNHLRKKVDSNFKAKLIHTVRGSGYMIREEDGDV